jgi:hypothetical protein
MVRRVLLAMTVFALFLPAQVQPSLMSAVNTDPLTTQNVFATLPPVLQSDLVFEKNILGQFGTFCYGNGAASAANTCYASPSSGSQTILSQSANQTFTVMILMATFAGAPTNLNAAVGAQIVSMNGSDFSLQMKAVNPNSAAVTGQFNRGDFSAIFIRLSDYFSGLNCGSNPGGNSCLLKADANPTIPYSFVNLPANVIFNANGTDLPPQGYEGDPSTSTSSILSTLVNNPGGTVVPEPGMLLLVSSGVLGLLRLRVRFARS